MEDELGAFGVVLIIAVISLGFQVHKLNQKIAACSESIGYANSQIEDMNSSISDAEDVQWQDYESMGQAIGQLRSGYSVDNPCLDLKK